MALNNVVEIENLEAWEKSVEKSLTPCSLCFIALSVHIVT